MCVPNLARSLDHIRAALTVAHSYGSLVPAVCDSQSRPDFLAESPDLRFHFGLAGRRRGAARSSEEQRGALNRILTPDSGQAHSDSLELERIPLSSFIACSFWLSLRPTLLTDV